MKNDASVDETDFKFRIFRKSGSSNPSSSTSTTALNDNNNQVSVEELPIIQKESDDYYNMKHKHRGVAMIFNHENFTFGGHRSRTGTDKDCSRIKDVLTDLNFDVKVFKDKEYTVIKQEINQVANLTNHTKNDCVLVVIMSHGDDRNMICAKDIDYDIKEIWEPFTNCSTLVGKPKLFFIQACRGKQADDGKLARVEFDSAMVIDNTYAMKFPTMADCLFMYSTQIDQYSFRNPKTGSWFIESLCEELPARAKKQDLQTILTFVNRRMVFKYTSYSEEEPAHHKKKQVGSIVSSLTRLVHFYK